MASAGTVEINFAAETAKFTAEVRKVRSQLTDLQKQTQLISTGFSRAGRAISGIFAGLTIGTAIRAVVRATSEAEESAAKLENALKSSGVAAQLSVEQLKNYASELQRTTVFGDEAVQGVESLLLSFRGLSGDTVLKATSAVLDLSTRMGVDLRGAAILVGKALSDPEKGLTALARAGVKFSADQQQTIKALIATGQASKAQAVILKELEARFGGAAAAARNTFGGAIAGVKNAFDDLLEAKGGMPGATSALNNLANTLNSPEIKAGFDSIITGVSKLVELSAAAAAGLPKLGSALGDFAIKANNIKIFDGVVGRLQAELSFEEGELRRMQKFSLFFSDKEIANQRAYIETLKERINLAKQAAAIQITPVATSVARVNVAADEPTFNFEASQKALELRQKLLTASISTMGAELEAYDAHMDELEKRINKRHEKDIELNNKQFDDEIQRTIAAEDAKTEVVRSAAEARYQAEVRFAQQKRALEQGVLSSAVGLLSALAVKSKAAARAQIILNRGLQIAQAVQNTAAAYTNALASVPYPANLAAAAQVAALGAVQIGIIAGTGIAELSNVNSGNAGGIGGSTLGTPSNPLPVTNEGANAAPGKVITINVTGPVAGPKASQWLIDSISDLINGNDTIIINGNSRQAAEIRGD